MRNTLRFTFLCLIAVCLVHLANAQCGTFYDGFESGTWSPTWTTAGGTYTRNVTTVSPGAGTYSFEQNGSSSHMQGTTTTFAASTPSTISFKAKSSVNNLTGTYFVIGDANTATNFGIFFCYFNSSGMIRVYSSGTSVYQQAYSPNTWYTIELRNINFTAKTYDIWINNVLGVANFPFRSTASVDVDRIYLYNLNTGITASYDDILVGGSPLQIASTGSSVACPGDSNGTASATVSGGTPTYNYQWSTSDTTASISNLLPGTYYLTVTDSAGCVGTDSALITAPPALVSSSLAVDPLCNGDSTGSIDLTAGGGTPPYSYSWSNGSTSEDPAGLPAGTYTVVITDTSGCTHSDTALIGEPTALVLNALVTSLACNGDSAGAIDLTPSGGTPGYTYTWNTSATSQDLSGLAGGTYSVFVSDSNGCSTGDIYIVNEPTALVSSGTVTNDNGTTNGAIDLTVTGGTPPFTYAWSNFATTEDLSGLTAGTYTVVATDSNGCTITDTFTVSLVIGIDGGLPGPAIMLYPNPGTGLVNLHATLPAPGSLNLRVADLRGRVVQEQKTESAGGVQDIALDLRSLSPGVYMISLESNGQTAVRKYVKQ